jgi:acyl carrier protein
MQILEAEVVRKKIAELIEQHMGIAATRVLEGTSFGELDKDFDSLALLEMQLLLEKEYEFEFDMQLHDKNAKLPSNVDELAEAVIHQLEQHRERQAIKAAKAAAKAQPQSANAASSL